MVQYRRNRAAGGTFFLTVALANRRSRILVDQIAALRLAITETRKQRPFAIEAIVILPDHLHIMMTLPQDDADFQSSELDQAPLHDRSAKNRQSR